MIGERKLSVQDFENMARIDDDLGIIGDWAPPSPSLEAFFFSSGILGYDINSKGKIGRKALSVNKGKINTMLLEWLLFIC